MRTIPMICVPTRRRHRHCRHPCPTERRPRVLVLTHPPLRLRHPWVPCHQTCLRTCRRTCRQTCRRTCHRPCLCRLCLCLRLLRLRCRSFRRVRRDRSRLRPHRHPSGLWDPCPSGLSLPWLVCRPCLRLLCRLRLGAPSPRLLPLLGAPCAPSGHRLLHLRSPCLCHPSFLSFLPSFLCVLFFRLLLRLRMGAPCAPSPRLLRLLGAPCARLLRPFLRIVSRVRPNRNLRRSLRRSPPWLVSH